MKLRQFPLPAHLSPPIGIGAIFPKYRLTPPNLSKQVPSSGCEGYLVQFWYWTSRFPHSPHFMNEFRSPLLIRNGPIFSGSGSAPSDQAFSKVGYCWKIPKIDSFLLQSPGFYSLKFFGDPFNLATKFDSLVYLLSDPSVVRTIFITSVCGFRETSVPE